MRLKGVKEVRTDIESNEVTVTYDDTKINYAKMADVLRKNYFPPPSDPRYLKSPHPARVRGAGRWEAMPAASPHTALNSLRQESFCRLGTSKDH